MGSIYIYISQVPEIVSTFEFDHRSSIFSLKLAAWRASRSRVPEIFSSKLTTWEASIPQVLQILFLPLSTGVPQVPKILVLPLTTGARFFPQNLGRESVWQVPEILFVPLSAGGRAFSSKLAARGESVSQVPEHHWQYLLSCLRASFISQCSQGKVLLNVTELLPALSL